MTTMFCGFGDPETVKFEVPVGTINAYLLHVKDEIQVLTLLSQKGVIIRSTFNIHSFLFNFLHDYL